MAWKTMDLQEQRVRFVVTAGGREVIFSPCATRSGLRDPRGTCGCGAIGIGHSRHCRAESPAGDSPDAPPRSWRIGAQMRQRYPDWGARKLSAVVARRRGTAAQHDPSHSAAPRPGAAGANRPAPQRFQRQGPNELWQMDFKGPRDGRTGRTSLGARRPQPLCDRAARANSSAGLFGSNWKKPLAVRCSGSDADGSRLAVVEAIAFWTYPPVAVADATRHPAALERIRHPQTQGKVERFHGDCNGHWTSRLRQTLQAWLDHYRWEHNHVRPHEALGMKTPATIGGRVKPYDPHPAAGNIRAPACGKWTVTER